MSNGIRADAAGLPYRDRSVTFLRIAGGDLEACTGLDAKREWLSGKGKVYAAWTGRYKTDVFEVDRKAAREALK